MANDIIRAQRPDRVQDLDEVHVPGFHRREISRVREVGHVPYRCTRCYRTKGKAGRNEGGAS